MIDVYFVKNILSALSTHFLQAKLLEICVNLISTYKVLNISFLVVYILCSYFFHSVESPQLPGLAIRLPKKYGLRDRVRGPLYPSRETEYGMKNMVS